MGPGGDLAKVMRAVCMISNTTAIAECSLVSTISLISCTPSELSFIGTSEREWRKASSQKHVKISLLWRRTTKRWASRLLREKVKRKVTATSSDRTTLSCAVLAALSFSSRRADLQIALK